ncbi:MAG TPA: hypothetical protein VGF84_09955 [Micromonosporaceae bacterium]|jgi:hypothetical protein
MSNFDQLVQALREDCDVPGMADAADLRRAGEHRTTVHRAIGGAATLAVAAGVTTGIVLLGSSSASPPAAPAVSEPAITASATAAPAPVVSPPAPTQPASPPVTVTPSPTSTHTVTAVKPSSSASSTGRPACVAGSFDVGHARIVADDASAIIGYDIHVKYLGTGACTLSQPPRVYYTTVNGQTLPFAIDRAHSDPAKAKPLTVGPGRTISVTVYRTDDRNDSPVPPDCASDHLYKGLAVSIDGQIRGLLNGSMTFPCSGPVSMAWTLA